VDPARTVVPCQYWPCHLIGGNGASSCPYRLYYCGGGKPNVLAAGNYGPPPWGAHWVWFDKNLSTVAQQPSDWKIRWANKLYAVYVVSISGQYAYPLSNSTYVAEVGPNAVVYSAAGEKLCSAAPRRMVWAFEETI